MSTHSFIDSIFRQFTPTHWQNGISIYRSGGVLNFEPYDELVSVRIKTGIGEHFDVRIKLHSSGRFVQWMECTCQANRRRGEKCAHIASFCIYLTNEKKDYLKKLNINSGDIQNYLVPYLNNKSNEIEEEKQTQKAFDYKEKLSAIDDAKALLKDNSIENIFSQNSTEIISIDLDKEEPWVNVIAKINDTKNRESDHRRSF